MPSSCISVIQLRVLEKTDWYHTWDTPSLALPTGREWLIKSAMNVLTLTLEERRD